MKIIYENFISLSFMQLRFVFFNFLGIPLNIPPVDSDNSGSESGQEDTSMVDNDAETTGSKGV